LTTLRLHAAKLQIAVISLACRQSPLLLSPTASIARQQDPSTRGRGRPSRGRGNRRMHNRPFRFVPSEQICLRTVIVKSVIGSIRRLRNARQPPSPGVRRHSRDPTSAPHQVASLLGGMQAPPDNVYRAHNAPARRLFVYVPDFYGCRRDPPRNPVCAASRCRRPDQGSGVVPTVRRWPVIINRMLAMRVAFVALAIATFHAIRFNIRLYLLTWHARRQHELQGSRDHNPDQRPSPITASTALNHYIL